jgi:hypothetical protein
MNVSAHTKKAGLFNIFTFRHPIDLPPSNNIVAKKRSQIWSAFTPKSICILVTEVSAGGVVTRRFRGSDEGVITTYQHHA